MVSRLQSADPKLFATLASAPASAQIAAAKAAARAAVELAQISDAAVLKALADGSASAISAAAKLLDSRYFHLEATEGRSSTSLATFSQARALAAVQFALTGNASEALYEALSSADAPQSIRSIALGTLRGSEA